MGGRIAPLTFVGWVDCPCIDVFAPNLTESSRSVLALACIVADILCCGVVVVSAGCSFGNRLVFLFGLGWIAFLTRIARLPGTGCHALAVDQTTCHQDGRADSIAIASVAGAQQTIVGARSADCAIDPCGRCDNSVAMLTFVVWVDEPVGVFFPPDRASPFGTFPASAGTIASAVVSAVFTVGFRRIAVCRIRSIAFSAVVGRIGGPISHASAVDETARRQQMLALSNTIADVASAREVIVSTRRAVRLGAPPAGADAGIAPFAGIAIVQSSSKHVDAVDQASVDSFVGAFAVFVALVLCPRKQIVGTWGSDGFVGPSLGVIARNTPLAWFCWIRCVVAVVDPVDYALALLWVDASAIAVTNVVRRRIAIVFAGDARIDIGPDFWVVSVADLHS